MRKKYTFLLTVLPSEDREENLQGKLQLVQSKQAQTFTNLDELEELIQKELHLRKNSAHSSKSGSYRNDY